MNIHTPQGKVDTLIEGTGSPIIFIHGTSAQASIWLPIIQTLQLNIDWQCICPNLPGSGKTPRTELLSIDLIAQQIISILDTLHIKKCAVVGISLGACLALYMASVYAERFSSVVSIGGYIKSRGTSLEKILAQWEQAIKTDLHLAASLMLHYFYSEDFLQKKSSQQIDHLIKTILKQSNWPGTLDQIELNKKVNIEPQLLIKQPTLLISGQKDQLVSYEFANQLYHRIPQAKLIETNTGHVGIIERPKEIANILISFIKSK